MRIKLSGKIIENSNKQKTNYNHEIYSMILSNISTSRATEIHTKKRFKRLFTFSNLYLNRDEVHFYISGEDTLIKDFINGIMFNQMIRIGDKVIYVKNIEQLENKLDKDSVIIKTDFIVNEMENGKVCLSKDKKYIENRIYQIAKDKYNEIYNKDCDGLIVDILSMNHKYTKYKNHHINYYRSIIKLSGDKELINLIYNVGIGENTASGHGFVWEV